MFRGIFLPTERHDVDAEPNYLRKHLSSRLPTSRSPPSPLCTTTTAIVVTGYYCELGTSVPTACPPATFGAGAGLVNTSQCTTCSPGSYCSQYGLLAVQGFSYVYAYIIVMSLRSSYYIIIFSRLHHLTLIISSSVDYNS